MCRIAAYLGPPVSLKQFLVDPPHSLVHQAWAPEELRYARLNADGYGFAWFGADADPALYVNPLPIWSDPNLLPLARNLASDLWIASVRSATEGSAVSHANTQPFCDKELIFTHNGFIREFQLEVRKQLTDRLSSEINAAVRGHTDSEYLFALLRQILKEDSELSIESALIELSRQVDATIDGNATLLNFIVSEGTRLYAMRHALNDPCPSLYYTTDDEAFPGGQLIASERLDPSEFWQPVPEHHLLILDPDEPPELIAL
jgi:glutamine amidotransferase